MITTLDSWTALSAHAAQNRVTVLVDGVYLTSVPLESGADPIATLSRTPGWKASTHGSVIVFKRDPTRPFGLEVTDPEMQRLVDIPALKNRWARRDIPEAIQALTASLSSQQKAAFEGTGLSIRDLTAAQREMADGLVFHIGFPQLLDDAVRFGPIHRALKDETSTLVVTELPNDQEFIGLSDSVGKVTYLGQHLRKPLALVPLRDLHPMTRQSLTQPLENASLSSLAADRTLIRFGDRPTSRDDIPALNTLFDTFTQTRVDPATDRSRTQFITTLKPFAYPLPESYRRALEANRDIAAFQNFCGSVLHQEIARLEREKKGTDTAVRVGDLPRPLRNLLNAYACHTLAVSLHQAATNEPPICIRERDNLILSGGATTLDGKPASGFFLSVRQPDGTLFQVAGNSALN